MCNFALTQFKLCNAKFEMIVNALVQVSRPLEPFEAIKVKPTWPPPFVTVLVQPKGFKPGLYRLVFTLVTLWL